MCLSSRCPGCYHLGMGVTDDGGARACAGVRWVGLCLCSVAITDTSMAGSAHKLLKQKRSNQACLGSVPFKCAFFFLLHWHWDLCLTGKLCQSKWGLCSYRGLILCLYWCLWLHLDTCTCFFPPILAITDLELGWHASGMGWVELEYFLGLGWRAQQGDYRNSVRSLGRF